MSKENEYNEDDINVLEGLDAVRKRPGMYIGGTSNRAVQHLLHEIVDNAIDEALAGHCSMVHVKLDDDGVMEVIDNGRGIPTGQKEVAGKKMSTLDVVFNILHAGGKFGGGGYKVSGGLHGVGSSVVNALSRWMEVEVRREKEGIWQARYERGVIVQKATKVRAFKKGADKVGTTVRWRYDDKTTFGKDGIFDKGTHYDPSRIEQYLSEKAYLVPGLTFKFDSPGQKTQTFKAKNGLADMVKDLNAPHQIVHVAVIREVSTSRSHKNKPYVPEDLDIEFALQWTDSSKENVHGFANVVNTPGGGTHVSGMRIGIANAVRDLAYASRKLKKGKKKDVLEIDDVMEGCTAVLSVQLEEPQFEGQTKDKLGNEEVKDKVEQFVYVAFKRWMEDKQNANMAAAIIDRAIMSRDARKAAREATRKVKNAATSLIAGANLPGKLADCTMKAPLEERELFIVEGDSAAGPAKAARERDFQGVLAIRGKVMNAVKDKNPLASEEIDNILLALGGRKDKVGTKLRATLEYDQMRYGKVVLLVDADDDGAHIAMLLMAFFHEYLSDMLKEGRVFLAKAPLFRITYNEKGETKSVYAYDNAERERIMKRHRNAEAQRFKGLGEMNADELGESCLDPTTRQLIQINVQDSMAAQHALQLLMAKPVAPRQKWLAETGLIVADEVDQND